jgi:hypothetical protein
MAYERSSYHKKWWVKTIRERNYFGFRYWWFNWSIWILLLFALCYSLFVQQASDNHTCLNRNNLSRRVGDINKALETCCSCNTPPPVVPPQVPLDTIPEVPPTPPPPPPPMPPLPPPQSALPCDSQVKSGHDGVTNEVITMGTQSGMVTLRYDMNSIPDKLEVIYEGQVISSTFQISGNDNGYVGGDNGAGATGILNFLYRYHIDQFVTVRVTGPSGTDWSFTIQCPN